MNKYYLVTEFTLKSNAMKPTELIGSKVYTFGPDDYDKRLYRALCEYFVQRRFVAHEPRAAVRRRG